MKAMLLTGKNTFALRDIPAPVLNDDSLMVQVEACAICNATDLRVVEADDPTTVWPKKPWPVLLGHEMCGTIVGMGPKVEGWSIGERVAGFFIGCQGFAEYAAVPADKGAIYRIPSSMPSHEAAVLELVTGTLSYCMPKDNVDVPGPNRDVFIVGLGPAGLFYVQECRNLGFSAIYASDRHEQRRALAKKFGATKLFHPDEDPFGALGSGSVDVVVDTTGKESLVPNYLKILRPGGVIIPFGVGIDWAKFEAGMKAKEIKLARGHGERLRAAKAVIEPWLANGSLDIASVITKRIHLEEIADALRLLKERKEIKVVVDIK